MCSICCHFCVCSIIFVSCLWLSYGVICWALLWLNIWRLFSYYVTKFSILLLKWRIIYSCMACKAFCFQGFTVCMHRRLLNFQSCLQVSRAVSQYYSFDTCYIGFIPILRDGHVCRSWDEKFCDELCEYCSNFWKVLSSKMCSLLKSYCDDLHYDASLTLHSAF